MNSKKVLEDLERLRELERIDNLVTVFGSSRFDEESKFYKEGVELGRKLGTAGFNVVTGGSGGLMEATNRGVKEIGKTLSIGIHLENLPNEERANIYLDKKLCFNYFFTRKIALINYSKAFIVLSGGFGTLDEFFEVLNLMRTGRIKESPIVLVGRDYWGNMLKFMQDVMLKSQTISKRDLDLILITDNLNQIVDFIKD
jgi:uncharacterized protein (TIGR00730 family)